MSLLTNAARRQILLTLQSLDLFMAFGRGEENWGTHVVTGAYFVDNETNLHELEHTGLSSLIVKRNGVVKTEGSIEDPQDYRVDYDLGVIHVTPASNTVGSTWSFEYYYGVNEETEDESQLIDEVFRKRIVSKDFILADEEGDLEINDATYSVSEEPTLKLMVELHLSPGETEEFFDSPEYIREVGVVMNTETESEEDILLPEDLTEVGDIIMIQHYPAIRLSDTSRNRFRFILTIS